MLPIDFKVVPRETLVEMRLIKGKWFTQGHKEGYRVRFKNGLPLPDTMVLAVHSVNSTQECHFQCELLLCYGKEE